ncbi:MAG TPA: alpha/beta family hydrolase [Nitrospira sp.]|nr:alpha/beta family hydrolase [Nitrospira sp.]
MKHAITSLKVHVSDTVGDVEALLLRPEEARWLLVLAHGAGAGMRHAFMESLAHELAASHIATLRYQFPYMQKRRGRPDSPKVLTETVRAAVRAASEAVPDLPLFAGGKSLGGRMTSLAFSEQAADQTTDRHVRGLVFVGFPLHQPGRPGAERANHLPRVPVPMLFLQGTRDTLADLSFLRPICKKLGDRATLHVVDGADHSFHVLKRSGRIDAEVLRELARTVVSWAASLG